MWLEIALAIPASRFATGVRWITDSKGHRRTATAVLCVAPNYTIYPIVNSQEKLVTVTLCIQLFVSMII